MNPSAPHRRDDDADGIPRRAKCRLSTGESFEGPVDRIGPTGVFLCTDRPGLQYSDGICVTLFDGQGPVMTFTGHVATWVRGRGIRVEVDPDVEPAILEQLGEWAAEEISLREPTSTPDLIMSQPPALTRPDAPMLVTTEAVFEAPHAAPLAPAVPLPGKSPPAPKRTLPPNLHRAASEALKGTRVLVVDDDPLILRMLSRGLRRFGCEVEVSDSPPDALELLKRSGPDVVLLDWVLPIIPGAEMLERMRESTPAPIAVVSGALWWDHAAEQIRALGASTVMEKPIDFESLVEWIRLVHGEQASS